MYRITGDFWDCWDMEGCDVSWASTLRNHFSYFGKFQKFIGGPGRNGLSFPDPDMIPLGEDICWHLSFLISKIGRITSPTAQLPAFRYSNFTQTEAYTLMTLFAITRSRSFLEMIFSGALLLLERILFKWIPSLSLCIPIPR